MKPGQFNSSTVVYCIVLWWAVPIIGHNWARALGARARPVGIAIDITWDFYCRPSAA